MDVLTGLILMMVDKESYEIASQSPEPSRIPSSVVLLLKYQLTCNCL